MDLSQQDRRDLASLTTNRGFKLLLDIVVKSKKEEVLAKLKTAKGPVQRADRALVFATYDDIERTLEGLPKEILEELKEERDSIYG